MGMGHAAASCWTTTDEAVEKFAKKEFAELKKLLNEYNPDIDLESFAQCLTSETSLSDIYGEVEEKDELEEKIWKAYDKVCKAFKKNTGLVLNIAYHDAENDGDRYDDVNGQYWEVEGVTQLTPAGKKMQKFVTYSRWTNFG